MHLFNFIFGLLLSSHFSEAKLSPPVYEVHIKYYRGEELVSSLKVLTEKGKEAKVQETAKSAKGSIGYKVTVSEPQWEEANLVGVKLKFWDTTNTLADACGNVRVTWDTSVTLGEDDKNIAECKEDSQVANPRPSYRLSGSITQVR